MQVRNKVIGFLTAGLSLSITILSCQNEQGLNYQRYFVNGKGLYEANCQNCHGKNGEGLQQLYPPLTDTTYLRQNKTSIACLIRNGSGGGMNIHGREFTSPMPGNNKLATIDIAQIIVYITNSFGNQQGFYSDQAVSADLQNCR